MDSSQNKDPGDKKIADIRKQITPGGDDSFEQAYSEDQVYSDQENFSNSDKKYASSDNLYKEVEEQRWEDVPTREVGQSVSLEPLPQLEKKEKQEEQELHTEKQQEQNNKEKETQNHGKQQNKKQKKKYYEQKQLKSFSLKYDSKFIYAAFQLLRQQFKKLIPPQDGFLRFNPYYNTKQILVYYYDEKNKQKIADIVDNEINQIQVMEIQKKQAQSGIQLSYKFNQNLLKQKISFFKDRSQNFKTSNYYICGKVKKNILYQKIAEIKNITFIWMHLFRFQNTRSYRAILRKIFNTAEMRSFVLQKFKAKQIQVAYLKRDFPLPSNMQKRGIMIIMTTHGQRKMSIHQQIQMNISNFIKDTFLIFCFTFRRRGGQTSSYKYTPKVQKVTWFFILQKRFPTSYLFIIVNKADIQNVKQTIIDQIKAMDIDIIGRRFFKNLYPQMRDVQRKKNQKIYSYPKNKPYSWTLQAPKEQDFDWVSQFNC